MNETTKFLINVLQVALGFVLGIMILVAIFGRWADLKMDQWLTQVKSPSVSNGQVPSSSVTIETANKPTLSQEVDRSQSNSGQPNPEPGCPQKKYYFHDTYTDAGSLKNYNCYDGNFAPRDAMTMGYRAGNGVLDLDSNGEYSTAQYLFVDNRLVSNDMADYTAEADFNEMGNHQTFGLLIRGDKPGECYVLEYNETGCPTGMGWTIEQWYGTGSFNYDYLTPTYLDRTAHYRSGDWVHLRVTAEKDTITGYADLHDGKGLRKVISGNINSTAKGVCKPIRSGTAGFRVYLSPKFQVKNFEVYTCQ